MLPLQLLIRDAEELLQIGNAPRQAAVDFQWPQRPVLATSPEPQGLALAVEVSSRLSGGQRSPRLPRQRDEQGANRVGDML